MPSIRSFAPRLHVPSEFEPTISAFLDWVRVERTFSAETISTYRRSLERFITEADVSRPEDIDAQALLRLKRSLMNRGCSAQYIAVIVLSGRCFLRFCRDVRGLAVMDPATIKPPNRPRRQVNFLSMEEVERFVASIPLERHWLGRKRVTDSRPQGLLYRALVETLLGSGMRISEALSLRRGGIDWKTQEARVVGKGNKERTVFFTKRALHWLRQYLELRNDRLDAVFVTPNGRAPLDRHAVVRWFGRQSRKAGLNKRVTAHVLRHTVATTLMFNGCPMGHIKEILGHERLDTTCRYYLGLDRRQAKAAMLKWLDYDVSNVADAVTP